LLSSSLPGTGSCGAQEPAHSSTMARRTSKPRMFDNREPRNFPMQREFEINMIAAYAI
jgi:hypothetical protein